VPRSHQAAPVVTRWLAESPGPATFQYAGLVRRFLEQECVVDLASVRSPQLIAHVQSLSGTEAPRKAATALSKFFAYLVKSGDILSNPAIDLIDTLKEQRKKASTHELLVAAGMTDKDAARVTWRDVARVIVGSEDSAVPPERMPPPGSDVMTRLSRKLLSRIKSCTPEGLETLLDRQIDA